jgi:hypothetical protein
MRQRQSLITVIVASMLFALASAAPAGAAAPSEAVRAALLTTDAAIESGRFDATMQERGFNGTRRVISNNTLHYAFNLGDAARLSDDLAFSFSGANYSFHWISLDHKDFLHVNGVNYWTPVKRAAWRKHFRSPHAKNPGQLIDDTMLALGNWTDDGPAVTSDATTIENYSATVDFSSLASIVLPKLTKIVHDGQFNLFISDPKKWRDATPAGNDLPRVTFGVGADNVLRKVHVEAPSTLTTQGYELIGDFEFTDVNRRVAISPLPNARRITSKNIAKVFKGLLGG